MLLPHPSLAPYHLSGTASSHVWNSTCVCSCLEPHPMSGTPSPCLKSHLLSGTPSHVWNPIPMSGNPSLVWNSISMSGTPSPCLESHLLSRTPSHVWNPIPMSEIPSPVWNPIACLEPIPTQCPTPSPVPPPYHLAPPHYLAPVPLPPSGPCCSCLAPNYPVPTWSGPRLSPIWNSYPCHPPPAPSPHPIKYHHQKSPPPEKEIWVFPSFPSFSMFFSISPCMCSILPRVIISFTSHGKNSQNSRATTPFPSIRYLYESPITSAGHITLRPTMLGTRGLHNSSSTTASFL